MPAVDIIFDGIANHISGLPDDRSQVIQAEVVSIAALPDGMQSGRPSVALVGKTRHGRTVFLECSLRIFQAAAGGFTGKYGEDATARLTADGNVEWPDDDS